MSHPEQLGFSTRAVHIGSSPDPVTGAVIPPLSLSTTFAQPHLGASVEYEYARSGNPTRNGFEACVAALENGAFGLAFSSGSATLATVLNALGTDEFAKGTHNTFPERHLISIMDVYGGTYRYMTRVASSSGWLASFVDLFDPLALEASIRPSTRLVWLETPTNPTLRLADISTIASVCKRHSLTLVVDNTFLSPFLQRPLDLGADIVVHSGTKYLNGHSDVVIGCAVTNNTRLYDRLKFMQNAIGAVPSPFDCYLAQRGLKTLALRMERHSLNALRIAEWLEASGFAAEVTYPGLSSHPQHELAVRQHYRHLHGGMISFRIKGDDALVTRRFVKETRLFLLAESLGGVESLCEVPAVMTHASVSEEQRERLGITEGLVRLSVGIEDVDDLIADLNQALETALGEANR